MCVQPLRVGAITSKPWDQQHDGGFVGSLLPPDHLQTCRVVMPVINPASLHTNEL